LPEEYIGLKTPRYAETNSTVLEQDGSQRDEEIQQPDGGPVCVAGEVDHIRPVSVVAVLSSGLSGGRREDKETS